ncbi:MAG: alpha/beta hydrolase [Anaerolineales bacterium]
MPFPYFDETKELNEITRQEASGSFVKLTDGFTHYELAGNEQGPRVVLVHGFSVPYYLFDNTFEFLCNSGFRVLRYDLFGRGFSDRPKVEYNIHLFVRQLKELLDALNFKDVNLLGLSMGGPVTASFIDKYPEYISSHIMIDPAGAKPIRFSRLLKVATLPVLGELIFGLFGSGNMVKNIASDLFTSELVRQFQAKYKIQMQYQGFKRAILSTIRNNMLESFFDTYQRIGKLQKPTLLFWGRQDATVPFEHSELLLQAIPHIQFHAIENCGHMPQYEKPEEVHPILLEFLKRK